ncbi:hypothetical protein BGZ58_005218 [Dissophora ornata]|nr:hypothetical protein BGZ58_005218 [Dissophora ornata]
MSSSVSLAGPKELWYSLVGCTNLKTLDLGNFTVPEESLQVFLQICARSLSLKLTTMVIPGWFETDHNKDGGNSEDQDGVSRDDDGDDDDSSQLVFTAPRHLSLSSIRGFNNAILSPSSQARIIRMFPNLKSLYWYGDPKTAQWTQLWEVWALQDGDTIDFFQTLSQNPWALQRLESLDLPWTRMEDEDLARLLRQMSQLKALAAHGSRFGPLSLEELLLDNVILSGDRGQRVRCLSETMERLQLHGCKSVTGDMVQLLLTSCPNLRRFSAEKITVADIALGHQGHRGLGWVCYRMAELDIYLEEVDEDLVEGNAQSLRHHVYSQLAKLTRLRKLNLTYATKPPTGGAGWRTLDLRLKSGLKLLSGLKELTDLSFQHDDHQRMGMDEVVWMTKQWPALRSVAGRLTEDKKARRRVKAVLLAKEIHVSQ